MVLSSFEARSTMSVVLMLTAVCRLRSNSSDAFGNRSVIGFMTVLISLDASPPVFD